MALCWIILCIKCRGRYDHGFFRLFFTLRVLFNAHSSASLDFVVSQILPHIAAKCPNSQAPWILLGMKKDLRTDEKRIHDLARIGKGFVTPEHAEKIGERYGAELVLECSSKDEPKGLWTLHDTITHTRLLACPMYAYLPVSLCAHVYDTCAVGWSVD